MSPHSGDFLDLKLSYYMVPNHLTSRDSAVELRIILYLSQSKESCEKQTYRDNRSVGEKKQLLASHFYRGLVAWKMKELWAQFLGQEISVELMGSAMS